MLGLKEVKQSGGYDEYCLGQPTNLLSGQIQEGGTLLTPKEIGATLLTLADIDHKVYLDADPIQAILKIAYIVLVGSNSHIQNMESTKHFDFPRFFNAFNFWVLY